MTDAGGENGEPMTVYRLDAVGAALSLLARVEDPRERLRAAVLVRAELDQHSERIRDLIRDTIAELRATTPPTSLEVIGELLGVSRQRAAQLAGPRTESTATTITEGTDTHAHR